MIYYETSEVMNIIIKNSNILENKLQEMFERNECTITVHNDLYYEFII